MKVFIVAFLFACIFSSCTSMRAGQKKMDAYNMHLNDHPDRNAATLKKMRKKR